MHAVWPRTRTRIHIDRAKCKNGKIENVKMQCKGRWRTNFFPWPSKANQNRRKKRKEKKNTLLNWKDRQTKSIRSVNVVLLRYAFRFSFFFFFFFCKKVIYITDLKGNETNAIDCDRLYAALCFGAMLNLAIFLCRVAQQRSVWCACMCVRWCIVRWRCSRVCIFHNAAPHAMPHKKNPSAGSSIAMFHPLDVM